MENKKRVVLISIISLITIALLIVFILATFNYAKSKTASAEFSDLTNGDIVNFNQYVLNQYTHNATLGNSHNYIVNHLLSQEHYYYVKIDVTNGNTIRYEARFRNYDGSTAINLFSGNRTTDFEGIIQLDTNANYEYLTIYAYQSGLILNNSWCIDLTQMFGDNMPTLEQCQTLFTAAYYPYSTGYPMFYGLNREDMLQSIDYPMNTGTLTGYDYNATQSKVEYNSTSQLILSGKYVANYSSYYLINFKTNVPKGSIITLNFNSYITASSTSATFLYNDQDQTYITNLPTSNSQNKPFVFSFMNSVDLSSLYLVIDDFQSQSDPRTYLTLYDASINVQFTEDYQFDLQAQYDLGYYEATEYYTNGYGHTQIYYDGYQLGYDRGVQEGSLSDGWNFLDVMFTGVGSVFRLEIFPNVTIGTFVLIPLLLGLIFFIVKLSRGGS